MAARRRGRAEVRRASKAAKRAHPRITYALLCIHNLVDKSAASTQLRNSQNEPAAAAGRAAVAKPGAEWRRCPARLRIIRLILGSSTVLVPTLIQADSRPDGRSQIVRGLGIRIFKKGL